MKWLDAPPVRVLHLVVTVLVAAVLLLGEPECAAALAKVGLAL